MSKEFGIYPENMVPHAWIGCRGILGRNGLDVPYDRWSSEFIDTEIKPILIKFVNEIALPRLEDIAKNNHGSFCGRFFHSIENFMFCCEYKSNYGDYLYCGFYIDGEITERED